MNEIVCRPHRRKYIVPRSEKFHSPVYPHPYHRFLSSRDERCLIRFRQEIYYQCDLKSFAFSKLRIFFQFHPWRRMRDPVANISRKIRFSQEATVFSRLLCPDSWAVFNVGCAKGGFLTRGPGLNGKFARVNGLQMFSCVRLQWEVDSSRFLDSA